MLGTFLRCFDPVRPGGGSALSDQVRLQMPVSSQDLLVTLQSGQKGIWYTLSILQPREALWRKSSLWAIAVIDGPVAWQNLKRDGASVSHIVCCHAQANKMVENPVVC